MGDLRKSDRECLAQMDALYSSEDLGVSRDALLSSQCGLNEELVREHIANTPVSEPPTPTLDGMPQSSDVPPVAFTSSGTVGGPIPGGQVMTEEEWAHYKNPWPKHLENMRKIANNPGAAGGAIVSGMKNGTADADAMDRAVDLGDATWNVATGGI